MVNNCKIFLAILFSVISLNAQAVPEKANTLIVTVSGIEKSEGILRAYLFNSEKTFLKRTLKEVSYVIESRGKVDLTFNNVSNGTYAVNVHLDINKNNKLDTNWMRIPKEPYGFSNNARGIMGPPKFEDARIDLISDLNISIHLN